MGWFSGDKKEEKNNSEIPSLPELPKLPDLPDLNNREPIHQLPSFPSSPTGNRFSQTSIKNAVGKSRPAEKESDRVFEADDFAGRQMMPKPERRFPPQPQVRRRQEVDEDFGMSDEDEFDNEPEFGMPEEYKESGSEFEPPEMEVAPAPRIRSSEPVFIRIDKFEASLKSFEKAKKQISEMEKNLKEIKDLKEEEEKELASWQQEILRVKEQIDRVDKDIFSKIE